jgi:hypothetical protein
MAIVRCLLLGYLLYRNYYLPMASSTGLAIHPDVWPKASSLVCQRQYPTASPTALPMTFPNGSQGGGGDDKPRLLSLSFYLFSFGFFTFYTFFRRRLRDRCVVPPTTAASSSFEQWNSLTCFSEFLNGSHFCFQNVPSRWVTLLH